MAKKFSPRDFEKGLAEFAAARDAPRTPQVSPETKLRLRTLPAALDHAGRQVDRHHRDSAVRGAHVRVARGARRQAGELLAGHRLAAPTL